MKISRWASLLFTAYVGLCGERTDAMRTSLADVRSLTYAYGAAHPGLESAAFTVDGTARSVTVGRNARKLVSSLSDGNVTAEYTYESGAPFVNAVTVKVDSVTAMTRTIGWDAVNDRITNITCTVGGSNVASFAYTWQTDADRIASVTLADCSYWVYDYDSRGHLASAERFFADGTPNDLNVHVSRIWSNRVELLGSAVTNATVTVNGDTADRVGEWFRSVITVDNTTSPPLPINGTLLTLSLHVPA